MPQLTIDERNRLTRVAPFEAKDAPQPPEPSHEWERPGGGPSWMASTFRELMASPEGRERLRQAFTSWPARVAEGAWHAVTGPGRAQAGGMQPGSTDELQTALRLGGMLGGTPAEVAMSHPRAAHFGAKMDKADIVDNFNEAAAPKESETDMSRVNKPQVPEGMEHLSELFT